MGGSPLSFQNASLAPADQEAPETGLTATNYSWVEISQTGKAITLADWGGDDDEGEAIVELPWSFPWFNGSYDTLYIDPNGNVGFDDWLGLTSNGDNRIPSSEVPNNRIAAFYEDMAGPNDGGCDNTGAVYTYYDKANQRFIVQYDNWCSWEDELLNTFEVILYSDGRVIVQYKNVPSSPPYLLLGEPAGVSSIGVEGPEGAAGYVWNGAAANNTAWLYGQDVPTVLNLIFTPLLRKN
jgi:hypothetical protein